MKTSHRRMRGESGVSLLVYLVIFIIALFVEFGFGMMTSEKSAIEAARVNGFSQIEVVDKAIMFMSWRGCTAADDARFTIRATNVREERVEFYVCASWLFKGSTIRTK